MKDSIKILEKHKGTFSHIENKKIGLDGALGMLSIKKLIQLVLKRVFKVS